MAAMAATSEGGHWNGLSLLSCPVKAPPAVLACTALPIQLTPSLERRLTRDIEGEARLVPDEVQPLDAHGQPFWPSGWGPGRCCLHDVNIECHQLL